MENKSYATNTVLMLIVTLGCTARCAHCCLIAAPEKANLRLTKEEMMQYIREAHKVGTQDVVLTGGEPTVYLADLYEVMILARSLGMHTDLRTNAHWARSRSEALGILKYLEICGLQRLGLSYDAYHEQYIPRECVQKAIEAAQILDMELYLDWIGFETMEYVTNYLGIEESVVRAIIPPIKIGAAIELADDYFEAIPIEEVECNSAFSQSCGASESPLLTVFPESYASCHQCCWVNPRLIYKIHGNHWLETLKRQIAQDPAVMFLKDYGVGGLIREARVKCPEFLKSYYSHQCEACYDLLDTLFPRNSILPWYLRELATVSPRIEVGVVG